MPVTISEHLRLPTRALEDLGVFDAVLDSDTRLFIDPALLRATEVPEFKSAASTLTRRFEDVMKLLAQSERRGDVFWRNAERLFTFHEMPGLCIGYSDVRGTSGSGMGEGLRSQLLETAREIVRAGVSDPAFFELLGLLEENVGADRISDMTARIIVGEITAFSERIFRSLGVEGSKWQLRDREYELPANPFRRSPILLLPMEILRELPLAESWYEIDDVISFNDKLRERVNSIIGDAWRNARFIPKGALRDRLLSDAELFNGLIDAYKKVPPRPYDFGDDRRGYGIWATVSRQFATANPVELVVPPSPTPADLMSLVLEICRAYAFLVEQRGLNALLYDGTGRPRRESFAQRLFYGIAHSYCAANNIDINPEVDTGRGRVDFKFSHGMRAKVVVETKLTSNTQLEHGFTVQVEEYAKAEQTDKRVYLVIDVDRPGAAERLADFKGTVEALRGGGKSLPVIVYVDGRPKAPASTYEPNGAES